MKNQDDKPKKSKVRKHLNADALNIAIRNKLTEVFDPRCQKDVNLSLTDALMSGFAMFQLKDPSLLAFERRCEDENELQNLKNIYNIVQVPAYSSMKDILDPVDPEQLRTAFQAPFKALQRGKVLEQFQILDDHYLLTLDGTGSFSSQKVKSASCQTKVNKKTGEKTYYQQVVGAALVHPDFKEVIPLPPQMVTPQDGDNKNDCERNAVRRWLPKFRQDHPYLKIIVTEDALSSNAPHIEDLHKHNMHYILGVKPGSHDYLYSHVCSAYANGKMIEVSITDPNNPKKLHLFHFINGLPLNKSNPDLLVNFIGYKEITPENNKSFDWITDFEITHDNLWEIMQAGRARWKIENETFNTLKNQGYHFEHNYGLGQKHLSEVYVNLMMLAFLVDQVQQLACPLFRAALKKFKVKKEIWDRMRSLFRLYEVDSMKTILSSIAHGFNMAKLKAFDTS